MPTSVIEHIRRTVSLHTRAEDCDGELLGRFVERHDEAALAALVHRHGRMVWGVCRRLLTHHDAEDAFQATFVVLVRKAPSIAPRELVGNWLYGVAHQAALQARRTAARRGAKEVQVTQMPDAEDVQQDRWADLRPVLDEELSRLPDHYRAVIVLSDLEGKTRTEVAAQLGCPEGTVASRLARARSMLARRLTQRGIALSAGALAVALSQNAASAAVPPSVVCSAIKAANLIAAGRVAIPVKVAALAEGVLKTMLVTKLKSAMAVLVAAAVVGLVGYGIALGQQKGDTVAPQKQESEPRARTAGDAAVKEKVEKKETTAWGKEIDGLQMGLALEPADARAFRQGEKARFAVKLRNVGKADVKVTHGLLRECPPEVTNSKAKISVFMPPLLGIYVVPTERIIKSGETITLYNPEVAVESEALIRLEGIMRVDTPTICVEPGTYRIAFGRMIQSHPKLATGKLQLEVKPSPAKAVEEKPAPAKTFLKDPERAERIVAESPKFNARVLAYRAEPVSDTIKDHNPDGKEIVLGVGVRDGVRLGHAFQIYAARTKDSIGVAKVMELEKGRCVARVVSLDRGYAAKSLKGLTAACTAPKPDKNNTAIEIRLRKNVWRTESLENKIIRGLLDKSGEEMRLDVVQED